MTNEAVFTKFPGDPRPTRERLALGKLATRVFGLLVIVAALGSLFVHRDGFDLLMGFGGLSTGLPLLESSRRNS